MTATAHRIAKNTRRMRVECAAASGGAECSAYVMKPEYLAQIENFLLMDANFMSKCLENAAGFRMQPESRKKHA